MEEALPLRRIVVGVDGSAASNAAVNWAVREASLRDAAVHLVCACHSDIGIRAPYASASWKTHHGELRAAAQDLLDRTAGAARHRLPSERLIAELADESPARALLRRAAGAEMLVVGATRDTGNGKHPATAALGPVARACVRMAHCPVVVVAFAGLDSGARIANDAGTREAGVSHGYLQGRGAPVPLERGGTGHAVDMNGRIVRVRAAAVTMRAAIERMASRAPYFPKADDQRAVYQRAPGSGRLPVPSSLFPACRAAT